MPPTVMALATGTLWHTCFHYSAPFQLQCEPKVCKCGNPAQLTKGNVADVVTHGGIGIFQL